MLDLIRDRKIHKLEVNFLKPYKEFTKKSDVKNESQSAN